MFGYLKYLDPVTLYYSMVGANNATQVLNATQEVLAATATPTPTAMMAAVATATQEYSVRHFRYVAGKLVEITATPTPTPTTMMAAAVTATDFLSRAGGSVSENAQTLAETNTLSSMLGQLSEFMSDNPGVAAGANALFKVGAAVTSAGVAVAVPVLAIWWKHKGQKQAKAVVEQYANAYQEFLKGLSLEDQAILKDSVDLGIREVLGSLTTVFSASEILKLVKNKQVQKFTAEQIKTLQELNLEERKGFMTKYLEADATNVVESAPSSSVSAQEPETVVLRDELAEIFAQAKLESLIAKFSPATLSLLNQFTIDMAKGLVISLKALSPKNDNKPAHEVLETRKEKAHQDFIKAYAKTKHEVELEVEAPKEEAVAPTSPRAR